MNRLVLHALSMRKNLVSFFLLLAVVGILNFCFKLNQDDVIGTNIQMKVSAMTAGGATIGGLAGGEKGAAIGALVGVPAGAVGVGTTAKRDITFPAESTLGFTTKQPLILKSNIASYPSQSPVVNHKAGGA
jgi:hypothetical protein